MKVNFNNVIAKIAQPFKATGSKISSTWNGFKVKVAPKTSKVTSAVKKPFASIAKTLSPKNVKAKTWDKLPSKVRSFFGTIGKGVKTGAVKAKNAFKGVLPKKIQK